MGVGVRRTSWSRTVSAQECSDFAGAGEGPAGFSQWSAPKSEAAIHLLAFRFRGRGTGWSQPPTPKDVLGLVSRLRTLFWLYSLEGCAKFSGCLLSLLFSH